MFVIFASPTTGNSPEALEEIIYKEIDSMMNSFSKEDMAHIINKIESSMIFDLDNNSGIARLLSYNETVLGDWHYASNYLDNIKSITPEEVKQCISKYFTPSNRITGILRDSRVKGVKE